MKQVQNVDQYLLDGCMRCQYGGTPRCKVHHWKEELMMLRHIVLECGLEEEIKWGVPCYTLDDKNVVVVSAFKDYASISFFKGVLLKDEEKLLAAHGEHSQSARLIKFTKPEQITQQEDLLKKYILEAVALEQSGAKVEFKKQLEPMPEELEEALANDAALNNAFFKLTPGRQRGYIIYFSQPKQSQTRLSRIEKCRQMIMDGVGLNDKYGR
jgi:uncharacterized protein YdeI (YjbR/CyaY-like superfamily)